MPTYTQIGSAVVVGAGAQASITFSSIPSTYTDLIVVTSIRTSSTPSGAVTIAFNGSSASMTTRSIYGNGSSTASYSASNSLGGLVNISTTTSSTFANSQLYIPNYAGSTNKSSSMDGVSENNATGANAFLNANLWSNSAAITSITLTPEGGDNIVQYSTAYLYGVSNA
jgi:hypothetical protein